MTRKILTVLLFMVTAKGLLLGLYHLYLPTHWYWSKGLTETPQMLQWALYALNDMWSALMILLHGVMLFSFKAGMEKVRYNLGFFLAAYWLVHAVIITLRPLPMPPQMQTLLIVLTAIPFIQFTIFLTASWNIRSRLKIA